MTEKGRAIKTMFYIAIMLSVFFTYCQSQPNSSNSEPENKVNLESCEIKKIIDAEDISSFVDNLVEKNRIYFLVFLIAKRNDKKYSDLLLNLLNTSPKLQTDQKLAIIWVLGELSYFKAITPVLSLLKEKFYELKRHKKQIVVNYLLKLNFSIDNRSKLIDCFGSLKDAEVVALWLCWAMTGIYPDSFERSLELIKTKELLKPLTENKWPSDIVWEKLGDVEDDDYYRFFPFSARLNKKDFINSRAYSFYLVSSTRYLNVNLADILDNSDKRFLLFFPAYTGIESYYQIFKGLNENESKKISSYLKVFALSECPDNLIISESNALFYYALTTFFTRTHLHPQEFYKTVEKILSQLNDLQNPDGTWGKGEEEQVLITTGWIVSLIDSLYRWCNIKGYICENDNKESQEFFNTIKQETYIKLISWAETKVKEYDNKENYTLRDILKLSIAWIILIDFKCEYPKLNFLKKVIELYGDPKTGFELVDLVFISKVIWLTAVSKDEGKILSEFEEIVMERKILLYMRLDNDEKLFGKIDFFNENLKESFVFNIYCCMILRNLLIFKSYSGTITY